MRYLMREAALLSANQWEQIDKAVVEEARKELKGRRFLSIAGPLGAQAQNVPLDVMGGEAKAGADYWANAETNAVSVASRRFVELTTIYADFKISWRDIENENGAGVQAAMDAAAFAARREDDLILYGDDKAGVAGILTAKGVNKVALADWGVGENPVANVAKALEALADKGCHGEKALIVSNDLYAKLHRIQPGTGVMEVDRVRGMVDGKLIVCPRMEKNKAALVCCAANNMDLAVGQDMITAYLGNDGLDHCFRVMETAVPRIKRPSAIAVIG